MDVSLEDVTDNSKAEVEAFLMHHEESSLFLISNLRQHGPRLTALPNSGNFKAIRCKGDIISVFMLTFRGNLHIRSAASSSSHAGLAQLVVDACLTEAHPLKGFIGDWDSVQPVFAHFTTVQPWPAPSYDHRNILFSLTLADQPLLAYHPQVRCLIATDFDDMYRLRYVDNPGDNLSTGLGAQEREHFLNQVAAQLWWGVEIDGRIEAMVLLNAESSTAGHVTAVYTALAHRRKGLARLMMLHFLKHCRDVRGHSKSVLTTDESDLVPQHLYESLGYQRIGHFALIFK